MLIACCILSSVDAAFISSKTKSFAPSSSFFRATTLTTQPRATRTNGSTNGSTKGPFQIRMVEDDKDNHVQSFTQYQLPPDAGPIATTCQFTEEHIHSLISNRSAAKTARQFEQADLILEELREAGVYLHDKRKEWRADGNNYFGRTNGDHKNRNYVMRGGDHGLTQEALDDIAAIVESRAQAKRVRDFLTYNDLGKVLKTTHGVHVNDKKREWSMIFVMSEDHDELELISVYVPSPLVPLDDPLHAMDEETKALIQKRLTERLMARRSRDYVLADFIQDKLQEEYSVVIDDRTREWTIETQSSDNDDDDVHDNVHVHAEDKQAESSDLSNEGADSTHAAPVDDASAVPKEEETESHLMTLTIVVLKEKLRDAGLPVSGKKSELVERLLDISN